MEMDGTDTFDEERMMQFLGRVAGDAGAAFSGVSTTLGGRLGLYRAMALAGPVTARQLADQTGLSARYVDEWLSLQVANEYVVHEDDTYLLPAEHAMVLANRTSPTYLMGLFGMLPGLYGSETALEKAFRSGVGIGWERHSAEFFGAVAESFRPGYAAALVSQWLPSITGAVAKLERGVSVADVGCGYGHSTVLMAKAFPQSRFFGYDTHLPSVVAAQLLAEREGVADRVTFELASAVELPARTFELITYFDCLHDLGDPLAALVQAEKALADDGVCLIIEPNAPAGPEEAVSPIARIFYAISPILCLPAALSGAGPQALGNHAGEEALREIAAEAGLRQWRLAAEGPVSRVYEVRRARPADEHHDPGLSRSDVEAGPERASGVSAVMSSPALTPPDGSLGIDEVLAAARARLRRLDPRAVPDARTRGAILVDIRPQAQRAESGQIPGAVIIERNVLEWRLDPRSEDRLPFADRFDLEVIIYCQEGYASSLAAASLQDLGLRRATDLAGGYVAWRDAGLPTKA
jgi:rhodanese-related sulfurtransferase/SAM-dependent methyltransferase